MTLVPVRDTTLHVEQRGDGRPLLLIHGAGEDSTMLAGQAEALAAAGYRVITYDRRGTGRSGRDAWPGNGADQHADDAAALLARLADRPATVLGLSSGAVVALALAARHPDAVARVVAWEPPAVGVLEYGPAFTTHLMAPVHEYVAAHPGDWAGAQAVMLAALAGGPVPVDDATRANAEPMVRDDPAITLRTFAPDDFAGADVTLAVGSAPLPPIQEAAALLGTWVGRPPVVLGGGHEVYLEDPAVLAGALTP
jgi:pimeloyl-ACP methyl ester carboxylesterase